jgi:hypothetical protein
MSDTEDPRPGMFAIMWDCHGLEACERVPNPADATFALLKGAEPPRPPNIMHWQLRAQANSHRFYEIYIITASPGIDRDDIVSIFQTDPQHAADTIRRIGHKFYSDRAREDRVVIR